jgi:hypothetical protein
VSFFSECPTPAYCDALTSQAATLGHRVRVNPGSSRRPSKSWQPPPTGTNGGARGSVASSWLRSIRCWRRSRVNRVASRHIREPILVSPFGARAPRVFDCVHRARLGRARSRDRSRAAASRLLARSPAMSASPALDRGASRHSTKLLAFWRKPARHSEASWGSGWPWEPH